MFVVIVTAPDGTQTPHNLTYGPQVVPLVSRVLLEAAPWLTKRETERAGLHVARGRKGVPQVHLPTGYVFTVTVPAAVLAAV